MAGYRVSVGGAPLITVTQPSAVLSGLSCDTSYAVGVDAFDVAGNRSPATTLSAGTDSCPPPPPPPPSGDTTPPAKPVLSLGPQAQTTLQLNWQAGVDNVGVDHYNVWFGRDSGGDFARIATVPASQLSYVYQGLTCATAYALGLEVVDAAGNKSSIAEATWRPVQTLACSVSASPPPPPPSGDTTPPSQPASLGVSSSTRTSVTLTWASSTDNVGVAGYGAYVNGSAGQSSTQPSATISDLACGTAYTFEVDAYDAAGNRSTRASVIGSTAACADTQPPTAPTNIVATSRTTTSIALSWSASSDIVGVTGYGLYRGGPLVGTSSSTTAIFSGLICNTNYTFSVDAYDAAGNRSPQTTIMVATTGCPDTTPPAKPVLSLGPQAQTTLQLNWQAGVDNVGVDHYNVWFGRDGGGDFARIATVPASQLSYVYQGLTCATAYALGLEVVDAAGNKSSIAEATWQPVRTLDCPTSSPPPPTSPPPTSSGTPLDEISDLTAVFSPNWVAPAAEGGSGGGGMWAVSTPHGPGFKFVTTEQMPAPWDSGTKACLAMQRPSSSPIGKTERWQFRMFFPNQSFPQHWVAGVLWQWHTSTSSGHHIALNADGTFRIGRQSGPAQTYEFAQGPAVPFDRWVPFVVEVKWSYGSDGFLRIFIDGQKYLDYSGTTVFAGEGDPYLQFGHYSYRQLTNEVWFADVWRS